MRKLSDEARYMRFLSTMVELSPSLLARFTQIDYDREMAIVAVVENTDKGANKSADKDGRESIIGVARYLLNPDNVTAEFALAVADEYQSRGIGSALMQTICEIARARGLQAVVGIVLARNSDMLALMSRLGFIEESDPDDPDMRRVVLAL